MIEARSLDPLVDFKRRSITKGRGFNLPPIERARAARGLPQAVVKVTSYASGLREATRLVQYITRHGELELETDTGEILLETVPQNELLKSWASDFDLRKSSRDVVHIVFSMPYGSDVDALRGTMKIMLQKEFPSHQALFVIHEDRDHPHAHVVVVMRDKYREKKLRLNKPELYHLRESYADVARDFGVDMAVSPRATRGIVQRSISLAFHHMKSSGRTPRVEMEAAQEILDEISSGKESISPWDLAIKRRYEKEQNANYELVAALRASAYSDKSGKSADLLKIANEIETFSRRLPLQKTRRQKMHSKAKEMLNQNRSSNNSKGKVPNQHEVDTPESTR